jgi:hypothetical protein
MLFGNGFAGRMARQDRPGRRAAETGDQSLDPLKRLRTPVVTSDSTASAKLRGV